jgi:HEPN domain-containing protein
MKLPRLLTNETPASWINIAIGSLLPIETLMKSLNPETGANKLGLAATAMAIGQLCAQACEFSLKGLLFQIQIDPGREHACSKLFGQLPCHKRESIEAEFTKTYLPPIGHSQMSLSEFLQQCGDKNVAWRYLENAKWDIDATKAFVYSCHRAYLANGAASIGSEISA